MKAPYRSVSSSLRRLPLLLSAAFAAAGTPGAARAQGPADALPAEAPLRQSALTFETAGPAQPVTLRDASRDARWLGLGVRDVRWAPDGARVYFRWNRRPEPGQDPEADPWFAVDREGRRVGEVADEELERIPGASVAWSEDGTRAAWVRDGALYLWDGQAAGEEGAAGRGRVRLLLRGAGTPRDVRFRGDGLDFTLGEDLHRWDASTGAIRRITRRYPLPREASPLDRWLEDEQPRLFEHLRDARAREEAAEARARDARPAPPQPIPVAEGERIDQVRLSPDGRWLAFRLSRPGGDGGSTEYMAYVTESGRTEARRARDRVGAPLDRYRLGVIPYDPRVDPDSVRVRWVVLEEAGDRGVIPHGPEWSLEGDRALVVVSSQDHHDRWIAELDPATGAATVLAHDRDDAWLGGPPIQPDYGQPGLVEWLPGGRIAFATERSGWSHLWVIELDGTVRPLTQGPWEVRAASLTRDRATWLLQASREDPAEDHLYRMPAAGGEMVRLTTRPGRHEGTWSPDGGRLAVVSSDNTHLPDLFLRNPVPDAAPARVTVSGTDEFYRHPLVEPEIVSFPHPDGEPVWAALYRPERPNPEHAAVLHIHGGGYRQFAHRGWTVYGWALHLGFLHHLLEQGYTVLDFDYRGSAGYGRDYRTDIYRSMGMKDVDGAVAAVDWLAREAGVDPERVGMYGVSYGGFMTLMSLFRYPGTFAAGIARAAVSDWSDYSQGWGSRILGRPQEDGEPFRVSSPIYYAEGLQDPLLITHGLVDDNVQFQDAAQVIQRLIELGKDFEVMVYPTEPHTIQTEASRWDYVRRARAFFDAHLRGR